MNWKRGVTRLYVALWVACGIAAGTFVVIDTLRVWDEAKHRSVRRPSGSVYRFPSGTTDRQISAFFVSPDGVEPATFVADPFQGPRDVTDRRLVAALKLTPRPSALAYLWEPIARDERADAPWRYTLKVLGLCLALGGIAPGALLVTVRWVWAGFDR